MGGGSWVKRGALFVLAVLFLVTHDSRPTTVFAEETLPQEAQELAAKISALESYRCFFLLEAQEKPGETVRLEGTLSFQRPNRRRLELKESGSKETSQLLVSDGKVEWQYDPGSKTAYRLANPPEAPGPHRPFAQGRAFRFVQRRNAGKETQLQFEGSPLPEVVRDSPVPIQTLRVEVGEGDGLVRELILLDGKGGMVLLQKYQQVELNVTFPEETFVFEPPSGVKVEELGGGGKAGSK